MDNLKIIYKILNLIEKSMDYPEFDREALKAERFAISEERFIKILYAIIREGYIEGITMKIGVDGYVLINISSPSLTVKGMEYLTENSVMKKIADAAKGIKETIHGL